MQVQAAVALTLWQHFSLNMYALRHSTTERPPPRPLSFPVRLEFDTTACLISKAKKSKSCRDCGQDLDGAATVCNQKRGESAGLAAQATWGKSREYDLLSFNISILSNDLLTAAPGSLPATVSVAETKTQSELCLLCGRNFSCLPQFAAEPYSIAHKSEAKPGTVENLAPRIGRYAPNQTGFALMRTQFGHFDSKPLSLGPLT
jgi:hypothetical protein